MTEEENKNKKMKQAWAFTEKRGWRGNRMLFDEYLLLYALGVCLHLRNNTWMGSSLLTNSVRFCSFQEPIRINLTQAFIFLFKIDSHTDFYKLGWRADITCPLFCGQGILNFKYLKSSLGTVRNLAKEGLSLILYFFCKNFKVSLIITSLLIAIMFL